MFLSFSPFLLSQTYFETAEVFSDVHVERLLLFALIWSYGGALLHERERKKFSQLLKTLTKSMPDDDSEYSVFDYYVDESGEWDVWQTRYSYHCPLYTYKFYHVGGKFHGTKMSWFQPPVALQK